MCFQSIYSIIHDWYLVSILEVSVWLPPTENKEVCSLALIVASQIRFLSAYLRCAYLFVCVWMCLFMSRQMQSRKCQVDHLTCIVLHQVHLFSEVWLFHLECSHRHLQSTHRHTQDLMIRNWQRILNWFSLKVKHLFTPMTEPDALHIKHILTLDTSRHRQTEVVSVT